MDGREAMALSGGSATYYIHGGGVGESGPGAQCDGLNLPPGFRPLANPGTSQAHFFGSSGGSAFSSGPSAANFPHGVNIGVSSGIQSSGTVKKKRGRPRKYGLGESVSLGLSSKVSPKLATPNASSSPSTPSEKRSRGRPPGSGRKQQLANLGEWMNSSAGQAFAPHVINIAAGEDIVAKILSFSQQRPRAVCIISGSGIVSSVKLIQPDSSGGTIRYEGQFEILCLAGSYLVDEDCGPHDRTGGISVSVSSPDGHVIGGRVGMLIASSPVQVVVCSFVYGAPGTKNKQVVVPKAEVDSEAEPVDKSVTPATAPQNFVPPGNIWPGSGQVDQSNPHSDIDLMRG